MSKNERVELARAVVREYARAIRPQDRRQLGLEVLLQVFGLATSDSEAPPDPPDSGADSAP